MKSELRTFLLSGEHTVKEIARHLTLSESRTRALLKEHQTEIQYRRNDDGQGVFFLPPDDFEASEEELAAQVTRREVQADKLSPGEIPEDIGSTSGANTCPLCQAEADQVQAGPEGSYLGAARTCAACNRTYNVHTKEEVKMAKQKTEGSKRAAPLNPQYKINQRIAAAEQAGGKLVYQREGRTWLLSKKGVEPKTMTAQEFSNETAETIHKYLGYTPPAPTPKAEKPAKTSKVTGSGKNGSKNKASAKSDAELVGA